MKAPSETTEGTRLIEPVIKLSPSQSPAEAPKFVLAEKRESAKASETLRKLRETWRAFV